MDKDTDSRDFAAEGKDGIFGDSLITSPGGGGHGRSNYRRLVLPDPAAFRYLEEDPSTTVLERRRRLTGYELYFIEQWGCSRMHPTYVIVTYTGQEQHSIMVGVLSIPNDESAWSPRLRVYLRAVTKYHARKRETPLGALMVTNLSGFPSALTVIQIPDGDLRNHREEFVTNENLKRLGCSGRAGLMAAPPTAATQTKFVQTYKTSDQLPIQGAVIELVKLCQVALMLFGKLPAEYADGLLCDVTEIALNEWWSDIGSDIFNIDPSDGILGPTTVSALLGLLMGARKRLSVYGAPVSKDVFDITNTKRATGHFQRSQKLERTRRLDKPTLSRLHRVTAKAASGEGWTMPRAVKSTVAELSGKGGDLVNGREKAAISEVETLDIETFIRLGSGDRFKWLWHGKPRKNNEASVLGSIVGDDGWVFEDNDQGGYQWSNKRKDTFEEGMTPRHNISDYFYHNHTHGSQTSMEQHVDKDQALRRTVLKNVTGRVKGVVGRRGAKTETSKTSIDEGFLEIGETPFGESSGFKTAFETVPYIDRNFRSRANSSTGPSETSSRVASRADVRQLAMMKASEEAPLLDEDAPIEMLSNKSKLNETRPDYLQLISRASGITSRGREHEDMENVDKRQKQMTDTTAIKKMEQFDWASSQLPALHTARSFSYLLNDTKPSTLWERRWPRQLSFTAMVDVLAAAQPSNVDSDDYDSANLDGQGALALERSLASQNRVMEQRLHHLKTIEVPWIEIKMAQIEAYDQQYGRDQSRLDLVIQHKTEERHSLQDASEELLQQERRALEDVNKDIETLGAKLEYELSALQSKVEDVEDGLEDFERQVGMVEARIQDSVVEDQSGSKQSRSWFAWLGY